jgi:hypothetical protein
MYVPVIVIEKAELPKYSEKASPICLRAASVVRKVELLMDLGDFTREQCETALRAASFNSDAASFYLLFGQIPAGETGKVQHLRVLAKIPSAVSRRTPQPSAHAEVVTPFDRLPEEEQDVIKGLAAEFDESIMTIF